VDRFWWIKERSRRVHPWRGGLNGNLNRKLNRKALRKPLTGIWYYDRIGFIEPPRIIYTSEVQIFTGLSADVALGVGKPFTAYVAIDKFFGAFLYMPGGYYSVYQVETHWVHSRNWRVPYISI
jgi:hypothetical protein